MTADSVEHDERLMSLVEHALALPVAAREAFLSASCLDDPTLEAEVRRRVRSEERMKGFLLSPLASLFGESESVFQPGELLNERFQVVRVVAEGGMGIVYEAWDQTLEKRVAIKCPRSEFRWRLPPEVGNATAIAHPNVCRVFEIHTIVDRDIDFLTMEFIEGSTLAERLRRGPLPLSEAKALAQQIGAGLAEAHRRGVIHGDLKAKNILLTREQNGTVRAVITDFGLALAFGVHQPTGKSEVAGTPDYMAPELFAGKSPSVASDIYALGVLFFEMVHADRPRESEALDESWTRWLTRRRRWDSVTAKCLSRDPAARYANVDNVVAAITWSGARPLLMVLIASVAAGATLWGTELVRRQADLAVPSVAVLPFGVEGMPPGNEYLSEGLADEVMDTLAQFPGIRVFARTSSFHFSNTSDGLRAIARQLGAVAVVSGQVRRTDNGRVRISAALINPFNATQLWGAEYSVEGDDLPRTEEVARQIADQVGTRLNSRSAGPIQHPHVKTQALELLLRGQYQRRLYTPESRQKAIGFFEAALAVDPQFALAHAELANTYRLLAGGGILNPQDAMPKAEAAARRALAVDANLAEGHAAMADVLKDKWDWKGAEAEYRAALSLNPNLVDAHMQYAILLSVTGRYEAALSEVQKVRALDPVGLPGAIHAASVHYNGRRFSAALQELQRARTLDPSAPTPRMWTAMVFSATGRFGEAVNEYRQAIASGDVTGATRAFYAYALAKSGARAEAQQIVQQLETGGEFVPLTALAAAYIGLDQPDEAIARLQQAYVKPDPILQYLKVEAHFDALRDRPEYLALVKKLQLP